MRVSAFRDGAAGPLGWIDGDGRIVLAALPARGTALRGAFAGVDLASAAAGRRGRLVPGRGRRARGCRGRGRRPRDRQCRHGRRLPDARRGRRRSSARLPAGVLVVQATRVGGGQGAAGAEARRRAAGWPPATSTPWKARILLRLALARGDHDPATLQPLFDG